MDLQQLTKEHKEWLDHNFPDQNWVHGFLGVVEEVGELAHALLKSNQGIRGTEAEMLDKAKDAVGDIVIFLDGFCIDYGIDLGATVQEVWDKVKMRDWTVHPMDADQHVG